MYGHARERKYLPLPFSGPVCMYIAMFCRRPARKKRATKLDAVQTIAESSVSLQFSRLFPLDFSHGAIFIPAAVADRSTLLRETPLHAFLFPLFRHRIRPTELTSGFHDRLTGE